MACIEFTRGNARCSRPISDEVKNISKAEWAKMRIGRISLSPKGYGDILKFIEHVCNQTQQCVSDLKQRVKHFELDMTLRKKLNEF